MFNWLNIWVIIKCKQDFAKRQKKGVYRYDTNTQSKLVANTRQYKKQLLKDNKLIKKEQCNTME